MEINSSMSIHYLQALMKSLDVHTAAGEKLEDVSVIDWAQLLWRCPSGSSETAAKLIQELPWPALARLLPGTFPAH